MTQLSQLHLESIIAACGENAAAIADSLNRCFDRQYRLVPGEKAFWNDDETPGDLDGPGLMAAFKVGPQAVLCLIPQSLPLPEWFASPDDNEDARLQALSLEWAASMLPAELQADECRTAAADHLKQLVLDAKPADWAAMLELQVFDAKAADPAESASPVAKVYLVGAVERPPFPPEPRQSPPVSQTDASPAPLRWLSGPLRHIDRQMLDLPVTVSVRLAEKKIEVGQLISITPGGLVTFNKGCDSLLDLYVNNYLYGRGEAVKIGEKFGLKVTQVGVKAKRKPRVL